MNRGFIYAFMASLLLPTGIIANKYLLDFVNPRMLGFLWFFSVFIGSSIVVMARESPFGVLKNVRRHWKDGLIVGGINSIAVSFFFFALNILDPATMAFLTRFSTIFTVVLGILLLKERIRTWEVFGVLLAVIGAFIINYGNVAVTAIAVVTALLAALAIAAHQVAAKRFIKAVHPLHLVNIRTFFTSFFLFLVVLATGSLQAPPVSALPILIGVAGILAVAGFFFFYKSLEVLEVSKAAVVRTIDPFIVILYSILLFSILPTMQELIGGVFIIAGVLLIMLQPREIK